MRRPALSAKAKQARKDHETWSERITETIRGWRGQMTTDSLIAHTLGRAPRPHEWFTASGAIDQLAASGMLVRVGHTPEGRWIFEKPDARRRKGGYAKSPAYRQAKRRGWRRGEIEFVDTDAENDV